MPNRVRAKSIQASNLISPNIEISTFERFNVPSIACNDTFIHYSGCGGNTISGNILENDYSTDGDEIGLYFSISPKAMRFSIKEDGCFNLEIPNGFIGTINFEYYIIELNQKGYISLAEVIIYVYADNDCDNVRDEEDLDNDNDGLLNKDEGNGTIDSDNDGITDDRDIDSDNDGITDNVEWQKEDLYVYLSGIDLNNNGWDDNYDVYIGGNYYHSVDTDNDGIPDFVDSDSDNDGFSDFMETESVERKEKNGALLTGIDSDQDGLDNTFDNVGSWLDFGNVCGSNSILKDSNNNGMRDWRDFFNSQEKLAYFSYPNPANKSFCVNHPHIAYEELFEIMIFDISGKLLLLKEITQYQNIDVSNFENGIYIVKIRFDKTTGTQQIIIKH